MQDKLLQFDTRIFITLFISFIAATIIGTFTHELGHYLVAKYYGFHARIDFSRTYWAPANAGEVITDEKRYVIKLGGPFQTILTGTIGLICLIIYRKTFIAARKLATWQWIIIFLSLFWLRQAANFIFWIGKPLLNRNYFSHGDEILLAQYYGLPDWSIVTATGVIGIAVLAVVIFQFIPRHQRMTFMAAGLSGGICGYYLWLILPGG